MENTAAAATAPTKKKTPCTSEERESTRARLSRETDEFIAKCHAKNYKHSVTDEEFDDMLENHPAFFKADKEITQEIIDNNPLLAAMQQLKYDDPDNTAYDNAVALKTDGNVCFKAKRYEKAVKAYTEALKKGCKDEQLLVILYTNRAAANYHLKNYRSALLDSTFALKLEPERIKSLMRCAQSCFSLNRFDNAMDWCKVISDVDPSNQFAVTFAGEAREAKKIYERDLRKKQKMQNQRDKQRRRLMETIALRGVQLEKGVPIMNEREEKKMKEEKEDDQHRDVLDVFDNCIESPTGKKVQLGENGELSWPVLIIYPEYKTSDFIESFNEHTTVDDHLEAMFAQKADWDERHQYRHGDLDVYVENYEENQMYKVKPNLTLGKILTSDKVVVRSGTPGFVVWSKSSPDYSEFLSKHKKMKWLSFDKKEARDSIVCL